MSRPTLLCLFRRPSRVDPRRQAYVRSAAEVGFRVMLAATSRVRVRPAGTVLHGGYEVFPGGGRRRVRRPTVIHPDAVLHRRGINGPTGRLIWRLADRHRRALFSFHRAYDRIGDKWIAERLFRRGDAEGLEVRRPSTWLVRRRNVFDLADIAAARPLVLKAAWASQCRRLFLSDPEAWESTFRRVRRVGARRLVVQEIPEQPALWRGRKFDLRIYAVLWSTEPLEFDIYREGIARIAAEPFDPDDPAAALATLTGDSYRARQRVQLDNVVTDRLLTDLSAAGVDTSGFWEEVDRVVRPVFAVLGRFGAVEGTIPRERTYFLTGLDLLPVIEDGALRLLFLEANDLPGLVDPVPEAEHALQEANRSWLADLHRRVKPGAPIARSVVGVLAGDSPPRAVEEVARALAASGAQIVSGGRAGPAATPASRRETHSGDSDATLDGSLRWWDTERAWEIDGPVQPDVFVRPRSGARSHPVLGVADAERIAELEHTLSAYDRARRTRSVARPRCYVVASRHAGLTRRFLGRSRAWEELAGNEITVFRERVEGQRVVAFAAVGTNGSVRTGSLLERRESGELVVLADPDPVVRAAVSRTARSFLEAVRAWAERNREEWRAPRLWRLDMVVRGDSALLVGGAAPPEVEATRPVLDLLTRDVLPGLYSAS